MKPDRPQNAQACARFVKQKVNTTAENLVKAILKQNLPLEREVATERTQSMAAAEIAKQVQLPPNVTVKMYMDVLKNDQVSQSVSQLGREGLTPHQSIYMHVYIYRFE